MSFFNGLSQKEPITAKDIDINKYAILQWTTENGLPQSNVHSIVQTEEGYLWFATFDGLVRYDGNRFTFFDPGSQSKITSSFITGLAVDKEGVLWVSSDKQVFKIKDDHIDVVWVSKESVNHWRIAITGDDILVWNNNSINLVENDSLVPIFNCTKNLSDVLMGSSGDIYLTFSKKDVFSYNKGRLNALIKDKKIKGLYKDVDLNIIASVREGENDVSHYRLYPNKVAKKEATYGWMNRQEVKKSIIKKGEHEIYISKHEILLVKNKEPRIINLKNKLGSSEKRAAFVDSENNIWIGTSGGGLFMLYPKVLKTIAVKNANFQVAGDNMVYQNDKGKLFMNFPHLGLIEFDEKNQSSNVVIKGFFPWTAIQDAGDTLWVGGISGNIVKKAPNKQAEELSHPDCPQNQVYSFFIDSKKRFWIGTRKGPAFKSSKTPYILIEEAKELNHCYQFLEDSKENIWICSGSGLGVFDGANYTILTTKDGLPTNDIRTIYEDTDGTYWIGTSKFGLLRYKDEKLFHFPYQDGRINPNVWTVVEDDFGFFWMTSNQGVYRLSKKQLNDYADGLSPTFNSYKYNALDGVTNSEFNSRTQNKGFKASDGRLWFSSVGGAVVVDPKDVYVKDNLYHIFIEEIFIDKQKISFDSTIVIAPNQSHIKINWSLPSYYQTKSMKFQVMLKNKDAEWINVEDARTISFNNLPANTYEFKVRLLGYEQETSFKLVVQNYFWQTKWFQVISVIMLTLIAAYIAYRMRLGSIHQKNDIDSLKNKLAHLEIKAMESKLNPHFIFNCLSSIQSLYNSGRINDANKYMSDFSDLLRIIILHAQVNKISLKDELDMLNLYIPLEQLQFDKPFNYQLNVSAEINLDKIFIPSVILHILVENAIKHGLKSHKNTNPILKLNLLRSSNQSIIVEIIDNGKGFRKGKSSSTHKSIGLQLLAERIELINQVENIKITLSHQNLIDNNNNVIGCMAKVEFKEID